jgi:hypothetical protein
MDNVSLATTTMDNASLKLGLNLFLDCDLSDDSDKDNDEDLEAKHRRHKITLFARALHGVDFLFYSGAIK